MTDQEHQELRDFWNQSIWPLVRSRKHAEAINLFQERLEQKTKVATRVNWLQDFATLLFLSDRDDDALSAIRQSIDLEPDNPISWCSLAHGYCLISKHPSAKGETLQFALDAVDNAVEKARLHGGDVRYCLNDRCRIVVAMKRYDLLEDTLREILKTRDLPGTQFEDDFLGRVPEGAVDPDLLTTYQALLAEQEARRAKRRASPPAKSDH